MVESRKKPRLYWDSCNFICLINPNEADRARECNRFLQDAERGDVEIATATLTLAEVIRRRGSGVVTPEEEKQIAEYFEHDYLVLIELDRTTAERSRDLSRQFNLGPRDAIHLASAIQADVDRFQTWDTSHFGRISGLNFPIEEPKWSGQLALGENDETA